MAGTLPPEALLDFIKSQPYHDHFEELYEHRERRQCCSLRVPLANGYVNFRYPARSSVKQAVAMPVTTAGP